MKNPRLTPTEQMVLVLACRGLLNKQIAAELSVTTQTVRFHLSNIYRKLGVHNRTGAFFEAQKRGLLDVPLHDLSYGQLGQELVKRRRALLEVHSEMKKRPEFVAGPPESDGTSK